MSEAAHKLCAGINVKIGMVTVQENAKLPICEACRQELELAVKTS